MQQCPFLRFFWPLIIIIGNLFFLLGEILTFHNSGALWVNWTWQIQVGWVGRCQIPPVCASVQVLRRSQLQWKRDIWPVVIFQYLNSAGLRTTEQYPSFHLMESLSWCPTDSTPMSRLSFYGISFRFNIAFLNSQPLIWIESVIERHAHSRIEIMVKAKSQFKRRLVDQKSMTGGKPQYCLYSLQINCK